MPILTQEARIEATEALLPELVDLVRRGVPESALPEMLSIWLSGTIAQLSDTPADIEIEHHIWEEAPDLRPSARRSLEAQVATLHKVMGRTVEALTPRSIWVASNAMNYALVRRVSRLLGEPWMTRPYRGTKPERLGEELLDLLPTELPGDLPGFRSVSEAWASRLGFSHLLRFQRLDELPPNAYVAFE